MLTTQQEYKQLINQQTLYHQLIQHLKRKLNVRCCKYFVQCKGNLLFAHLQTLDALWQQMDVLAIGDFLLLKKNNQVTLKIDHTAYDLD